MSSRSVRARFGSVLVAALLVASANEVHADENGASDAGAEAAPSDKPPITPTPSDEPTIAPSATPVVGVDPQVIYREHTLWPWLLVGLGGAVVLTGVIIVATAPAVPPNCDSNTGKCLRTTGESDQALVDAQDQTSKALSVPQVGVVVVSAGAAIMGAGLLWHFLEPTGVVKVAKSVHILPWTTRDGAGVGALGTF